ncbi:uncharacterized protein RJT21DRAFT_18509 [Scheffersomyces amazonensis]|uniref:uncharacterized protein n=1 Tax=Scheffersomyces amazonensis TaxID=1078765 RepID=UPI00315D86CC
MTSREENPLLEKLSPQQFEASVHFYEADQKLSPEDREELASELGRALLRTNFMGYGAAAIGAFAPTIYKISQTKSLPAGGKIYKPFGSFFIGLTTLLVSNQLAGKYYFNQSAQRDLKHQEIWRAMDYHQLGLFYLYYLRTAKDSSFIAKDPRTFSKSKQHEVHYSPPPHMSQNESSTTPLTQWDKIRISNGFAIDDRKKSISTDDDDPFNDFDDNEVTSNTSHEQTTSAWDAIRKNNK